MAAIDPFWLHVTIYYLYAVGLVATFLLCVRANRDMIVWRWYQRVLIVVLSIIWPILIPIVVAWGIIETVGTIFRR